MKTFYIAHVRGPDFDRLRRMGFTVLYPTLDDYVFLEVKPENEKLLRKQLELGVAFLKKATRYLTVTEIELQGMQKETTERVNVNQPVQVISGFAENLEGVVLEMNTTQAFCRLQGYNRQYEVWVDKLDIAAVK